MKETQPLRYNLAQLLPLLIVHAHIVNTYIFLQLEAQGFTITKKTIHKMARLVQYINYDAILYK